MHYKREIAGRIEALCEQFPAVVLTGARQTGKTTLLRELFSQHHYVSLDLPSAAELAEREPEQFLSQHPAPLLVDEVQYAPGLFRHLKIAIDRDRHSMGRFILAGSQKFNLMKAVSDHPRYLKRKPPPPIPAAATTSLRFRCSKTLRFPARRFSRGGRCDRA